MDNEIVQKIIEKTGQKDLLDILTKKLSSSELNSLMIEVQKIRAGEITPSELLKLYEANRFVKPYDGTAIELLQLELDILKIAQSFSFTPVELSPVTAFGTCSIVAKANQNKIISALRGTEVLADATNSLCLHICSLKRGMKDKETADTDNKMRFCASHRHVRAQNYNNSKSLPHFKLFCMVTAGIDRGSYIFEKESILEHLNVYKTCFEQLTGIGEIKLRLIEVGGYTDSHGFITKLMEYLHENLYGKINILGDILKSDNQYYTGLQFKIYLNHNNKDLEIADGGFVDWSQKLLQTKKERMLISGMGIERLLKIIKDNI